MYDAVWLDDVQQSVERSLEQIKQVGRKREQSWQRVGWCINYDDWQGQCQEILFSLDVLVHADKRVEACGGSGFQQGAVAEGVPAHFPCGADVMTRYVTAKPSVDVVIEEQFHRVCRSVSKSFLASSSTASACSRETPSNPSRNSSMVSPAARESNRFLIGTRVP